MKSPEYENQPQTPQNSAPSPGRKSRWIAIAAFAAILALGIGIGIGVTGRKPEPAEPTETMQSHTPPETTVPPETVPPSVWTEDTMDYWQDHVLREDETPDEYTKLAEHQTHPVFGSGYQRKQIKSVTFVSTLADMTADAWDVSADKNGKVMAWVQPNGNLYDLYIGAEGGIRAGESCMKMFSGYVNAEKILFHGVLNTSATENMFAMFQGCKYLTRLDLSGFDTSSVKYTASMFRLCECLPVLELSGFDTSSVEDMSRMFNGCKSLPKLDLSSFNTSAVTDMSEMFLSCYELAELDLSSFKTHNVKNMNSMFYLCESLPSLNVGSFDTSDVRDMSYMFAGCESLTDLTLGNFDTTSATNLSYMFSDCTNLVKLDLSSFDTLQVQDVSHMFESCLSLTDLILSEKFVTIKADTTDMALNSPADAIAETALLLSARGVTNVLRSDQIVTEIESQNEYPVFGSAYLRKQIRSVTFVDTLADMPGDAWDVSERANGEVMAWVEPNGALYDLYIGAEGGVRAGFSCVQMFSGYTNVKEITFGGALDTSNTFYMNQMFTNCNSLKSLDLSGFDTADVISMAWMFGNCESLTKLNVTSFNTGNVTDMYAMFRNCKSLMELDVTSFSTWGVDDMREMFRDCTSLTNMIRDKSFVSILSDTYNMFENCPAGEGWVHWIR